MQSGARLKCELLAQANLNFADLSFAIGGGIHHIGAEARIQRAEFADDGLEIHADRGSGVLEFGGNVHFLGGVLHSGEIPSLVQAAAGAVFCPFMAEQAWVTRWHRGMGSQGNVRNRFRHVLWRVGVAIGWPGAGIELRPETMHDKP